MPIILTFMIRRIEFWILAENTEKKIKNVERNATCPLNGTLPDNGIEIRLAFSVVDNCKFELASFAEA